MFLPGFGQGIAHAVGPAEVAHRGKPHPAASTGRGPGSFLRRGIAIRTFFTGSTLVGGINQTLCCQLKSLAPIHS